VLAPTSAIAQQWRDKLALFGGDPELLCGNGGPLQVLTYQAICRTADPGDALRAAALDRLAAERAASVGEDLAAARAVLDGLQGQAAQRRERDLANAIAALKREVARGERLDADFDELLAPAARARVQELVAAGVQTVVLDECHHLASLWGYLVRTALAVLGPGVHVVGLTATPPRDLRGDEAAMYAGLLSDVDFEIPLPAVVRDGHLAPYQELAFFTTPLQSERTWLDERHVRFAELLDRLHDTPQPGQADLAFSPWVIARMRYRDSGDAAARVPFATLAARRPELARAGVRYLHEARLELPDDAPRGEGWRLAPTLEDWLVLIGDYAVGCLRAHPGAAAEGRFEELATGLGDLGFALTRTGVRRGGSEVDRVLIASAAKPLAAVEVLAAEAEARGDGLRAAVLCDAEHPPRVAEGSPLTLSGGARGILRAFGDDVRSAALRPLLVTAETLACLPGDAAALGPALGAVTTTSQDGLVVLGAPGWGSQERVGAAGRALAAGTVQCVVGTRGLLGEGWDAPVLNVVVDLTTVAADVSVRQLRGRALRLDPADPDKVAANWDVVCVAPDLARGSADYERFVRRHGHVHAPCEDGSIETGVSHVHPLLSSYAPPPETEHRALNAAALARAGDLLGARTRWRLGEPYVGEDVPVLLVRPAGGPERPVDGSGLRPGPPPARLPKPRGATLGFRLGAAARAYLAILPLDQVAAAIVDAYVALGEITREAADSLVLAPRPGGTFRVALPAGRHAENARLATALELAIGPAANPRYVVSRPAWPPGLTLGAGRRRALTLRRVFETSWHPVPADLATHKERAAAYHAAWQVRLGPGELLFCGREGAAGREAAALAASAEEQWFTSPRTLWV